MGFLKRNLILQGAILRFHVKLWEGTVKSFFGGEQKLCFYSPKIISLLAEDCYFWSFNFLLQIPDSLRWFIYIYIWGYQVISLLLSGSSWGERTKSRINKHFWIMTVCLCPICRQHAIGMPFACRNARDDRPRIPELLVWPFQSFPCFFPVVSGHGATSHVRHETIAWNLAGGQEWQAPFRVRHWWRVLKVSFTPATWARKVGGETPSWQAVFQGFRRPFSRLTQWGW